MDGLSWVEAIERGDETLVSLANRQHRSVASAAYDVAHALWYHGESDKALPILEQALGRSDDPVLHMMRLRCLLVLADENKAALYEALRDLQSALAPMVSRGVDGPSRSVDLRKDRRLRLGFCCTYAHLKPVEMSIVPLLRVIDRERFEVVFFSLYDEGHALLNDVCDSHVFIPDRDLDGAFKVIKSHDIDILFDLNGVLREDFPIEVFARQAAPVQAGWWNTPLSSGLPTVQYYFSDAYTLDPVDYAQYSEKIIQIPGRANYCYQLSPDHAPTPALSRKTGILVFGSFTALFKHNDEVLNTWAQILKENPATALFIKSHLATSPRFRQRLYRVTDRYDINRKRLIMEDVSDFDTMMRKYSAVDVCLNTFSYGGGTTVLNAIWAGIPTLTFAGGLPQSRSSANMLADAGLGNYVVEDKTAYIKHAGRLARKPDDLVETRQRLREHVLSSADHFIPERFARNFEAACRHAWHDWVGAQTQVATG